MKDIYINANMSIALDIDLSQILMFNINQNILCILIFQ